MSKSLDRVLQPDGSYKWQEVELIHSTAVVEPAVCPAPEPVVETEVVNQKDFTCASNVFWHGAPITNTRSLWFVCFGIGSASCLCQKIEIILRPSLAFLSTSAS